MNQKIIIGLLTAIVVIMGIFLFKSEFRDENFSSFHNRMMGGNNFSENKVPFEGYSKQMAAHCSMMPEMPGCEKYTALASKSTNVAVENKTDSSDISNLASAKKAEIIELKNGDTYTMEVTKVKKEIGNKEVQMLAYNGSIPGPVIKVAQNSEITLKFINKVPDLETTLHSHGLRLDNAFDGVPVDMMGKQKVLKYGESFEYKLKFPDAGIYWYHPHVAEDMQQAMGLYGNYLVEPTGDNYWSKVNREETLVLDDILMDNDKIEKFSSSFSNYVLMGRYGNTMMINGDTAYTLNAKKGEVLRMYFTNVSNTRPYNIHIPGAKIKLVGGDNGKYEKETFIENFTIAPAERYVVDVYFPDSGTFEIQNITPVSKYTLGKVVVSNEKIKNSYKGEFDTLRTNKDVISDIDKFRPYFDKPVDKNLTLSLGHKGMKGGMGGGMMGGMNMGNEQNDDGIEREDSMQAMNKNSNSNTLQWKILEDNTGKENMDINWKFKVGDKVKIKIYNDPNSMHPMQHPIHFHGQRFLVISRNGVAQTNLVWKDTTLIKKGETVEILVDMNNPGDWMSHCHIAEHLMSGMMMHFVVEK
ncbi:MAG: multicopper oxidase family protein [Candidatus Gracilibacteria bacterium]|nr:multicopper oxidase family protein [Candidatus Gracilibacteria bacterium]